MRGAPAWRIAAGAGIVLALGVAPAVGARPSAQVHLSTPPPTARLIVAVPLPGSPGPAPEDLATELRLSDPGAAALVGAPGDVLTDGDFTVAITPTHVTIDPGQREPLVIPLLAGPPASPSPSADLFDSLGPSPPPAPAVLVVEVLGDGSGIAAHRIGDLRPAPDELRVPAWRLPPRGADAVMLDHAWWTLGPAVPPEPVSLLDPGEAGRIGERLLREHIQEVERLVDLAIGDVTGDGEPDLAVSFRRPFRNTFLNADDPDHAWRDAEGRSAHVGVLRPDDASSIWVAGTLRAPVARLAACDGALAVTYDLLDDARIVGGSAWDWEGFGFLPLAELPGPGIPVCIDVDRDGRTDPAIIERSEIT